MSKRAFRISICVLAAVIMALAGAEIAMDQRKTWDSEHPMANVRISWEQSFHPGAWAE